ncbi:F-box protein At1g61340-like [Gastrolobium bilobum]|uniref:F-box protein At1g61340-like n=1 Tax=Gastrolobium bilobum TaxID=150636 RepID=UPI002AB047D5|nr:F-box protein At1g61340-like [Gastrolobium bilobum]
MALVLVDNGYTGTLGRKRIVVYNNGEASPPLTPLKRMSVIKVLCGVDHEDLKQLFHVSKTIRKATLIAKQHFDYLTPKKKILAFPILFETPNAPLRKYNKSRLNGRKLADIAGTLFASMDGE